MNEQLIEKKAAQKARELLAEEKQQKELKEAEFREWMEKEKQKENNDKPVKAAKTKKATKVTKPAASKKVAAKPAKPVVLVVRMSGCVVEDINSYHDLTTSVNVVTIGATTDSTSATTSNTARSSTAQWAEKGESGRVKEAWAAEVEGRGDNATTGALVVQGGAGIAKSLKTSDRSLKEDITSLDDAVGFINSLRPVLYRFKYGNGEAKSMGLVAQDGLDLCQEYGMPEGLVLKWDDHYTLDYSQLLAPLIRCNQQLFYMLTEMAEHLERLEK
ncbi:hypothetical protein HK104_001158 [Borealophlyctis nickersoniae]|nr:hypothetical protein HK104_001158 [Borealophlyctis nickersoniae]